MAAFNANMLIRELRSASGLTQEQLAEGICTRKTIYSIEKGVQKPDLFTFNSLMKRLNVNPMQYYNDVASEDDMYIFEKTRITNKMLKASDFEGLKTQLNEMEQDNRFAEGLGYSFLLTQRSTLYSQGAYMDTNLAIKYSMEYLKIFRPNFEIEKIPDYFLSDSEINIINNIATAYIHSGNAEKSLEIRYMLMENIEKHYTANIYSFVLRTYHTIIKDIAKTLVEEVGRYEECIQIAEKGMDIIKNAHHTNLYIHFAWYKGTALMHLGRKQESEDVFKRCIAYSFAMGKNIPAGMTVDYLKSDFEKKFGYKLDLFISV